MAGRNLPQARVFSNVPERSDIHVKVTFGADVAAAVGTINLGAAYLDATTPMTRTAEGLIKFNFKDPWKRLVGFSWTGTLENVTVNLKEDDLDGSSPFVHLRFETGSTGADIDPDSGVYLLTFQIQNSQQPY